VIDALKAFALAFGIAVCVEALVIVVAVTFAIAFRSRP
jgi:hypothetical protein